MKRKITKFISVLTITLLLVMQVGSVWAVSPPSPPAPPEAPSAPENTTQAPTAPEAPAAPEAPTAPEAPPPPEAPTAPTLEELLAQDTSQSEPNTETQTESRPRRQRDGDGGYTGTPTESSGTTGNQTGGQTGGGKIGDSSINTGNATNTATISTTANTNLASSCGTSCGSGEATVKNSDNGSGSTNSGSVKVTDNNTTVQNNTANVDNNLTQTTNTGTNSASRNTGGDSTIVTGDANTSGTIITAVNTNVDGVAVAEFNVADDHVGDIVLDFAADCILGCGGSGEALAANTGNGADSQNSASIDQTTDNATFQNNDAAVENNMTLASDSGHNQADRNTGGDSTIETGDANVSANALTFANNNLAGNVYYYVVNIFGDLIGDIIFPEELLAYEIMAANSGNGADSINTASITQTTNDALLQTNSANIQNNLVLSATTGGNETSRNTNGNSSIETGDASVEAQVLNIANSNLSGGNWWLVIINEAGKWIGKILGAPDGAFFAGSQGTEFTVNEAGEITAVNSGNGAGSTNNASVTQTNNSTTVQNNNANITNNLDLSANTGGNSASRNTGGDSSITTGDANIIANLVNFVNNNITGGGKLFVTVVNVFGSWLGDFVTPGNSKDKSSALADSEASGGIGGASSNPSNTNSSSHNNSPNSDNGNEENDTNQASTAEGGLPVSASVSVISKFAGAFSPRFAGYTTEMGETPESVDTQDQTAAKKVININLAWLLVLVPAALLLKLLKKRLVLLKG